MFTDKDHFTEFQYLELGDEIMGTLCGYNGETQQFTGVHDKNGKEIYEGDIVRWNGEIDLGNILIKWDGRRCAYSFGDTLSPVDMQNCEIIGNIYQTPELFT